MLTGSNTGWTLSVGDKVRARVVAISLSGGKVGLTTRQPFLGSLAWIEAQKSRAAPPKAKKVAEG
jgi:DNA-directed RNA polymerase subunit E'